MANNIEHEEKTVYRVLSMYLNHAEKSDNYVKGTIDGKEQLDLFLKDYNQSSKTKFIIRSSCKKNKEFNSPESNAAGSCTRYGRADRIYWEFNNRNLVVPFCGMPFITKSSQVKHCQYGAQYYKLKEEKQLKPSEVCQGRLNESTTAPTNSDHPQLNVQKRRRIKPSKKRNCPAYMYVREVVLFPDFALSASTNQSSKHNLRKSKSTIIHDLKQAMGEGKLNTIHRYFVQVPLPEAHSDHPHDNHSRSVRVIDPFVREKIDELLEVGVYEIHHIQLIVHDYVNEIIVEKQIAGIPVNNIPYPSEQDINDYIFLSSISKLRPPAEESGCGNGRSQVQDEMEKSMRELMQLIQSCSDSSKLTQVKNEVQKVIQKLKRSGPKNLQRRPRKRRFPTKINIAEEQVKRPRLPHTYPPNHQTSIQVVTTSVPQLQPTVISSSNNIMCQNGMNREMVPDMMLPFVGGLNTIPSHMDMVPTFSRLMEDDHDFVPSLVDRVVGPDPHYHPHLHSLGQLHDERLNSVPQ